jgi:hypothetical protein
MNINKFEGQDTLTTFEGHKIYIELYINNSLSQYFLQI